MNNFLRHYLQRCSEIRLTLVSSGLSFMTLLAVVPFLTVVLLVSHLSPYVDTLTGCVCCRVQSDGVPNRGGRHCSIYQSFQAPCRTLGRNKLSRIFTDCAAVCPYDWQYFVHSMARTAGKTFTPAVADLPCAVGATALVYRFDKSVAGCSGGTAARTGKCIERIALLAVSNLAAVAAVPFCPQTACAWVLPASDSFRGSVINESCAVYIYLVQRLGGRIRTYLRRNCRTIAVHAVAECDVDAGIVRCCMDGGMEWT